MHYILSMLHLSKRHLILAGLVATVGLSVGCKKESEEPVSLSPEMASQVESNRSRGAPTGQPAVPQNVNLPATASTDEVLAQLNREVRRWIMRNQRPPANFEEFVSSSNVEISPAPPGKKYALTKQMKVVLENK
jgi:hypothetical protein